MPYERRDRLLATYAPIGMLGLLVTWIGLAFLGYAAIFWGLDGATSTTVALELSGSSLFTLGFLRPTTFWLMMVSFTEAAIGLFLLALLITYLPSINGAFSRREQGVTALAVRAGEPPSGTEMVLRFWRLERMSELHEVWLEWERWFVDIEETHTSFSALAFFRSPQTDHSWVTAAGAVLDAAALTVSSIDVPHDVQADICIRAGYLSLRRIAEGFGIAFDREPAPGDPISITRQEWDDAMDDLVVGRRGDPDRSRPGMARLRRLARELRHGAARARRPHRRPVRDVVVRSRRAARCPMTRREATRALRRPARTRVRAPDHARRSARTPGRTTAARRPPRS